MKKQSLPNQSFATELASEGFVIIPDAIPESIVRSAQADCELAFESDLITRSKLGIVEEWCEHPPVGLSRLDSKRGRQVILRAHEVLPSVSKIVDTLLADEFLDELLRRYLGKNYVMGDCMVRRLCRHGETIPQYELHRDNPYELSVGVLLDSIDKGGGSTVVHRRSHLVESSRFHRKAVAPGPTQHWDSSSTHSLVELVGKPGDAFAFLGETYHGGALQQTSGSAKILFAAFFPNAKYFPADPKGRLRLPGNDVLRSLPQRIQRVLDRTSERPIGPIEYDRVYEARCDSVANHDSSQE